MNLTVELASELLYREAFALDNRNWDEWLELYVHDCEYWVPAWKSEHETTADPSREVSLIYYSSKAGLEERVFRVRSGRSAASVPMPRTLHLISNVRLAPIAEGEGVVVHANWIVHQYRTQRRETDVIFGRYRHHLIGVNGNWAIRRKKITVLNDYLPAMIDFFSI